MTTILAWAVPVLVVGQFAMLAIVPIALAQTATVRHTGLRALRPWTVALTGTYTIALILWAVGPDRAPSLSKDMHPISAALIVAAALATLVAIHVDRRRPPVPGCGASSMSKPGADAEQSDLQARLLIYREVRTRVVIHYE